MLGVATLISNPRERAVTDDLVERAARYLPHGRAIGWLDPQVAVDVAFLMDDIAAGADEPAGNTHLLKDIAQDLRDLMAGASVDVVVQPDDMHRRKRLLLADMDSTMIGQECIDELADFAGLKEHVAAITERAMRGEIAFEPALRERVALLKALPETVIDDVMSDRIRLTEGGTTVIATMRASGAYTCLVSGGFTVFTGRIAKMIGFDEHRGNVLLLDGDGHLSGAVQEPILGQDAKVAALAELTARLKLSREQTLVVGDGANDIPMIERAGLGVAYHAKPKVAAAASARIEHGDLTALLYMQGYRRDEFVSG